MGSREYTTESGFPELVTEQYVMPWNLPGCQCDQTKNTTSRHMRATGIENTIELSQISTARTFGRRNLGKLEEKSPPSTCPQTSGRDSRWTPPDGCRRRRIYICGHFLTVNNCCYGRFYIENLYHCALSLNLTLIQRQTQQDRCKMLRFISVQRSYILYFQKNNCCFSVKSSYDQFIFTVFVVKLCMQ